MFNGELCNNECFEIIKDISDRDMIEIDRIHNMDCIEGMSLLGECTIDLTVTSPPYDSIRDYGNSIDKTWCKDVWEKVIDGLYRVTKKGGVVVWVVGDGTLNGGETGTSFKQALYFMDCGFTLHDTMIYQKHNPIPNTGNGCRYQQSFEYMFVFSKGKPKTTNIMLEPRRNECNDKRTSRIIRRQRGVDGEFEEPHYYEIKENVPKSNIWNYKVGLYNTTSYKEAFMHPAIFPEKLAEDHVESWSNIGDLVFDPFMGSGTTAVAAIRKKRHFVGFELNSEYCKIAEKRIAEENEKKRLELF